MNEATIVAEPGTQNITITREFDATPEQVFGAHVDPDLFVKWCGPNGYTMDLTVFEPKDGGRYAFRHTNPESETFDFRGVFHGEPTVDGITQTFEFLGFPGLASIETVRFEDLGNGCTRLIGRSTFPSVDSRDGILDGGMETGVNEGCARLDGILAARGGPPGRG